MQRGSMQYVFVKYAKLSVVILKIRSSMHNAKARVHRLEVGSLLAGGSEEGNSTWKCWKRRKKER